MAHVGGLRRPGCPFRGTPPPRRRDSVVGVLRTNPRNTPARGYSTRATRALVVDLSAPEGRDNLVVLLVGGIGIAGLAVMLAIDLLVFSAF